MVEIRRFGLARSRLTAIPCFASMTNCHLAKTLQPQLTRATPKKCERILGDSHQTITLHNKIQNNKCRPVFYGGG